MCFKDKWGNGEETASHYNFSELNILFTCKSICGKCRGKKAGLVDKLVGFDYSHSLSQCDLIKCSSRTCTVLHMYLDTEMYNINIDNI